MVAENLGIRAPLMTFGEYSMPLCHFLGKNVWILKPTSLNRGQGIHVANSFKKIKRLVRDYCRGREMSQCTPKLAPPSNAKVLQPSAANTANTGEALLNQILAQIESNQQL
jgi:hypothetical protein